MEHMKCIRLESAGMDVCVTVEAKAIFQEKANGELAQELERLDISRLVKHLGAKREDTLAQRVVEELESRLS